MAKQQQVEMVTVRALYRKFGMGESDDQDLGLTVHNWTGEIHGNRITGDSKTLFVPRDTDLLHVKVNDGKMYGYALCVAFSMDLEEARELVIAKANEMIQGHIDTAKKAIEYYSKIEIK